MSPLIFEIGEHVSFEGREALVLGFQLGRWPEYRLGFLDGNPRRGRVWVHPEELERLPSLPPLGVGDSIQIAGLSGQVEEVLPNDRYRASVTFERKGVRHRCKHVVGRWQLALS
ncbi:MAG: hypothetical protein WBH85_03765 [Thermoanaerobaculia bacterium]